MINLRYHIVSITAVFLALGIGIAMGSSFLSDAAVDQVGRNIESTRNEARAARAEAGELREEVARRDEQDQELRDQAAARLFRDDLDGVPVVVLTVGGVDAESLGLLRTALETSRADLVGTLTITGAVAAGGDDAETLARLLDREGAPVAALRSALAAAVADELLAAAEPAAEEGRDDEPPAGEGDTETTAPEGDPGATVPEGDPGATVPDGPVDPGATTLPEAPIEEEPEEPEVPEGPVLIRALVDAGVLDFEPGRDAVGDQVLEGAGHRYVIVSGPGAEVPDGTFFHPLLRAMTEDRPAPVVVASASVGEDAEADREAVLGPILAEDVVAARLSTVDDLESLGGVMAVVLSLDDLGRDRRGHYGVGPNAESRVPAP